MSKYCDSGVLKRSLARPLCLRYMSGVFRSVIVKTPAPQGTSSFVIHWGLGCLPNDEHEVLGVWVQAGEGSEFPLAALEEPRVRGVMRLRAVTGTGVGGVTDEPGQHQLSLFRGGLVVPVEGVALSDSSELRSQPPSVSDGILFGDRLANDIHTRLTAALARRKAFASQSEAMAFVASALHRADCKLWAPSEANRAQRGPAPITSGEAHH